MSPPNCIKLIGTFKASLLVFISDPSVQKNLASEDKLPREWWKRVKFPNNTRTSNAGSTGGKCVSCLQSAHNDEDLRRKTNTTVHKSYCSKQKNDAIIVKFRIF